MMNLLALLESILYLFCIYSITTNILGGAPRNPKLIYILSGLYIPLFAASLFANTIVNNILYVVFQILTIGLNCALVKHIKFRSIFTTYIVLYSSSAVIISIVFNLLPIDESMKMPVDLAVNVAVAIAIFIITKSRIRIKLKTVMQLTDVWVKRIILFSTLTSAIAICLVLESAYFTDLIRWNAAVKIAVICLTLFIGITFPLLIVNSTANTYHRRIAETYEKQIEMQAKHYQAIAQSNYELRRFRHDYNNLRIGLSELVRGGQYDDAVNMLEDCNSNFHTSTKSILPFDTGNGIVDAILTEKQQQADALNITIQFEGSIPTSAIAPTDFCIIFGNTLDNAIEACEKLPSDNTKTIAVSCICNSGFMFLKISNPVVQAVKIRHNTIASTKQDAQQHGFGLYSLNRAIQKYDGDLTLKCEENIFYTQIDLPLF